MFQMFHVKHSRSQYEGSKVSRETLPRIHQLSTAPLYAVGVRPPRHHVGDSAS